MPRLQAISSILDIQKVYFNNPQLSEIFRESQNRIRSMALIHEELYRSGSENHSRDTILVNTRQYVTQLLDHLFFSYNVELMNMTGLKLTHPTQANKSGLSTLPKWPTPTSNNGIS